MINRLLQIASAALVAASCTLPASAANDAPRPSIFVPYTALAPAMTADVDDPAWSGPAIIASMTPSIAWGPAGKPPLSTQIKLLWDANNVYIRFICAASQVYSPYTRHDDPVYKADAVEVFLDAKGDARQWIELDLSPNNIVFDQMTTLTCEPVSDGNLLLDSTVLARDYWVDPNWDMQGLRTAARILKTNRRVTGWIVDFALPADQVLHRLGRDTYEPMTLRANFLRYEYPNPALGAESVLEAQNWAPVMYGCPHMSPAAMGFVTLQPPGSAKHGKK